MSKKTLCLYGGNFWPPGMHHYVIADHLVRAFDDLIIIPCGTRRDKASLQVDAVHKKKLVELNFAYIFFDPGFDFSDLETNSFTPTFYLQEQYQLVFPDSEIWHAIGPDLIQGGSRGESQIQKTWVRGLEVWHNLLFAVVVPEGMIIPTEDLPPNSQCIFLPAIEGRSTLIRKLLAEGNPEVESLLVPEVYEYILEHGLFGTATTL